MDNTVNKVIEAVEALLDGNRSLARRLIEQAKVESSYCSHSRACESDSRRDHYWCPDCQSFVPLCEIGGPH